MVHSIHSAHTVCCVLMVCALCMLCVACAHTLSTVCHCSWCTATQHSVLRDGRVCPCALHCLPWCARRPWPLRTAHAPITRTRAWPCGLCMLGWRGPARATLPATRCPLCVGPVRCAVCDVAVRRCGWRPGSTLWLLSGLWGCHACAVLCAQWLLAVSNLCAGAAQPNWRSPSHKGECRVMAGVPLGPTPTLARALSRVRSLRVPTPVCPVATHRALSMAGARPAQGSVAPPKCKSCVVAGALRGPTPT